MLKFMLWFVIVVDISINNLNYVFWTNIICTTAWAVKIYNPNIRFKVVYT